MQRLEVSGVVRLIYRSLGVKGLNNIFPPKKSPFFDIMQKNMIKAGRPQMTTWRVRIACWVNKVTNTDTWSYEILNGFPQQQCFIERASMLRLCVYVDCLVNLCYSWIQLRQYAAPRPVPCEVLKFCVTSDKHLCADSARIWMSRTAEISSVQNLPSFLGEIIIS